MYCLFGRGFESLQLHLKPCKLLIYRVFYFKVLIQVLIFSKKNSVKYFNLNTKGNRLPTNTYLFYNYFLTNEEKHVENIH